MTNSSTETRNIINEKVDGESFNHKKEFSYSVTKGLLQYFPSFIGHKQTTNLYKLLQTIDRGNYRLREIIEVYKFLLGLKNKNQYQESAFGTFLDNLGQSLGITRELYEPDINYMLRLKNLSNQLIYGATVEELKKTIYYFIGTEAFSDLNDIKIINKSSYSSEIAWATSSSSVNPKYDFVDYSSQTGQYYWNDKLSFSDEDYKIQIYLIDKGDDNDRTSYGYWIKNSNISLLYYLIKTFVTVGKVFTIEIIKKG